MVVACALMDIRTSQVMDRSKTSSHFAVHIHVSPILTRLCCGKPSEVVPSFPFEVPADHDLLTWLWDQWMDRTRYLLAPQVEW